MQAGLELTFVLLEPCDAGVTGFLRCAQLGPPLFGFQFGRSGDAGFYASKYRLYCLLMYTSVLLAYISVNHLHA